VRVEENSNESIPYPETLREAEDFVIKYKQFAIDDWIVKN